MKKRESGKLSNAKLQRSSEMCGILSYIVLALILPAGRVECLRLTKMSAPSVIDYRTELELECHFDMGDEQLYAVKWYKDDNEFFRYMPHQQPHQLIFPVAGVRLVNETIDCGAHSCQLTLDNLLRMNSSGAYRCEVSSEAPAFRLASETHNVTVAALPKDGPRIEDLADYYIVGDILAANCLSAPSDPPQAIAWYINNELAPSINLRDVKHSRPDEDGLASSSQLIRVAIEQKHKKQIDLSCVAFFAGAASSARSISKTVPLFEDKSQVHHSNPRYTYWHSSAVQSGPNRAFLLLQVAAILGWLRSRWR